ncbi:MAG: LuxR C-terminal-related transcriptional regulator [Muribaculaceae bacterium]|nr:LuxR C-terminal-related transcriptional regulator [Muribaculaceae bacterium]
MLKIALIGLSSLENIAFREISAGLTSMNLEFFAGFENLRPIADKYNAYIVKSELFLLNSDFFLPRKNQTIVIFNSLSHNCSTPLSIFHNTDQAEIESMLASLENTKSDKEVPTADLSVREKEVLKEVAGGLTNKEIAEKLNISVNTVITHRKNLSGKLGIRSASGLSLYALMNGLI